MSKPALLILSHKGFGFVDLLKEAIAGRGLDIYILSSFTDNADRIRSLSTRVQGHKIVEVGSLRLEDVQAYLAELRDTQIIACISAWEGYRMIMASTNSELSACDNSAESIRNVLDKYFVRQQLKSIGTSSANCDIATPETIALYQSQETRKFVKPRRGLGSYGTFSLKPDLKWNDITSLIQEMKNDQDFQGVFDELNDFLIEDFVEGQEFSFEVLAVDGACYMLMAAEKPQMTEKGRAVLEELTVIPPRSISELDMRLARQTVQQSLNHLDLKQGLFHIEMRFSHQKKTWDFIEINPRIGGSYLSQSFEIINNTTLSALWVRSLVDRGASRAALRQVLTSIEDQAFRKAVNRGIVFRIYFGEPGQTFKELHWQETPFSPKLNRLMLKVGDKTPESQREIYVGESLWTYDYDVADTEQAIIDSSADALRISYETGDVIH